jgi:predicted MFS family arabinose efflux permease
MLAPTAGGRVVIAIVAITIASQFFRSSTSAIAPELIHDLSLSPQDLGLANAAFFLSLMIMQIPIGMLFDRFGPRTIVSALTALAVLGALLHAIAASQTAFILARLLVGLGCAGSFMAAVVLCSRWYAGARFATMLSRVFALSNLGYLLAGTPWAALAELLGWRGAFAASAAAVAIAGYCFFALVQDGPGARVARRESLREVVFGLRDVWRIPGLLPILALHFIAYAAVLTVFGVWAGPYLNDVYGLDSIARGNVLLAMGLAQMAATLLYGPLDRWLTRKRIVVSGAIASIGLLIVLVAVPHLPMFPAIIVLVLFSGANSFSIVNVADANSRFPPHLAGRGATAVNLFQVVGTSALPIVTGAVIGFFPAGETAYRAAFAVIAASLTAGLALYGVFYARPSIPRVSKSRDQGEPDCSAGSSPSAAMSAVGAGSEEVGPAVATSPRPDKRRTTT